MSDALIDYLKRHLKEKFELLKSAIESENNEIVCRLYSSSNQFFLTREALSIFKHSDGDELAITVDFTFKNENWEIVSDIVLEGGKIIATGPALATTEISKSYLCEWLHNFQKFLDSNTALISSQILLLDSENSV